MKNSIQILNVFLENPALLGLVVLVLFALAQNFFLTRRLRRLTEGGDGKSLEGTIRKLVERVQELEAEAKKTRETEVDINARLSGAIRGVAVRRFDPFQNAGGQQSFSAALLNERGDGVVLSGIHARDSVRVYAKNISKFESDRELSSDEKEAIEDAKKKL